MTGDTPPSITDVLTIDELAELLRIGRSAAYEAVKRGEIPGVRRIGKRLRVSRSAVLDWLHGGSPDAQNRSTG